MKLSSKFKLVALVLMFVALASVSHAAVYGYITVRGKDQVYVEREIGTIERLIKEWHNGEVLYVHTVKSGAIFFKKVVSTVFFAGNQKDIAGFLTSGSYEGDYLRDVVVKFTYSSCEPGNCFDSELNTTFSRKYANIRKALETIQGKNSKKLWAELEVSKKGEYKKHAAAGMKNPRVSVVFYSVQPVEENRLFGMTFTAEQNIPVRSK